jgi:hypothetical protein
VSEPDDFPAADGANVTSNGILWPDAMVSGNETPAIANCELLLDADDTVTLPPVALRLEDWVVVVPTSTLPKLIAVGATVSCPIVSPVPLKGTFRETPEM